MQIEKTLAALAAGEIPLSVATAEVVEAADAPTDDKTEYGDFTSMSSESILKVGAAAGAGVITSEQYAAITSAYMVKHELASTAQGEQEPIPSE